MPPIDGTLLRCMACGAAAAVTGPAGADLVLDRAWWPELGCLATPGCPGVLAPEVLN